MSNIEDGATKYADLKGSYKYGPDELIKNAFISGANSPEAKEHWQQGTIPVAFLKTISTEFFYWWYNSPGENTQDAFDTWWTLNKEKYEKSIRSL